ncbi:unnamed protein product [Eruca vesicaria subsp. sativa]|uniref:Uncharacterized protein n=1 Tax=Eruca vesicaria subsp. sativa TaxID=29727 RepID=A0ABC8KHN3_ERUVS|nr:unnamed protein product [Eruca vesicaria subsp. sativa]
MATNLLSIVMLHFVLSAQTQMLPIQLESPAPQPHPPQWQPPHHNSSQYGTTEGSLQPQAEFALELPDTSIETRLQPPPLDAGEPSGRRRRVLRFGSSHLSRFRFVSTVNGSPPTWFSVSVNISAHAKFPPRRKLVLVSRRSWLSHYRSGSTGSDFSWGIPQPVEILAGFSSRFPSPSSCCYAHLPLDEYPPLVGVEAIHPLQVEPHKPDPPPSPHRNRKSFSYLPTLCLISPSVGLRPEPMTHHSPNVSHPVTHRCTSTVLLSSFRRGQSVGHGVEIDAQILNTRSHCLCVPPGTYGNKQVCPCYNNWKTQLGGPKCP